MEQKQQSSSCKVTAVKICRLYGVIHKGRPQNISQNWPPTPLSAFVRIGPTLPPPLRTSTPDYRSWGYWTWPLSNARVWLFNTGLQLCTQLLPVVPSCAQAGIVSM